MSDSEKKDKKEREIYYPHIFPLLCLAVGFVLASLCLSAGNKPGFMEEYALVRVYLFPSLPFRGS